MIDIFLHILPVTTFIIITSITPGPNNIMLATSGASVGYKRSLPLLLGISTGFLFFLLVTTFGFNIIFGEYPKLYSIFKILGALYLLYLSYLIISSALLNKDIKVLNFKEAIIFQFVNPKVWGMSMTAISSFSVSGEDYLISALMISFWFIIIYIPSGSIWIVFGSYLRSKLLKNELRYKQFNVTMGALLLVTVIFILTS